MSEPTGISEAVAAGVVLKAACSAALNACIYKTCGDRECWYTVQRFMVWAGGLV